MFLLKQSSISSLFYILILLQLFSTIYSQEVINIRIGQTIKGEMPLDESHKYYSLTIPRNESNRLLIVKTHEDSSVDSNTKTSFSDPDFYISKKNKYPSSRRSSEWYSEQYGSDIMSIPAESVGENDIFYIGMYCQFKCRYFLKIETGVESELELNKYTHLILKPYETMNYKIKIENEYDKIKVMAVSTGKFKIFMNQNSPSSANSYPVIPSWHNGYVIILTKNMREYCTNCEYHLIVYNEESEEKKENDIMLRVVTEEKNKKFNLNKFRNVYDALEENSKTCFDFNITERQKYNEKLIIDLTVYSGDASLLIEGWRSKNLVRKYDADREKYSYKVIMEQHIILEKKDFDAFDKEEPSFENKDSVLNMCLYSQRQISFSIQAYFLTSLEKIFHTSILTQGNKLRAYLLKDQVINYELVIDHFSKNKNDIKTNITVTENIIVGNTTLYGYFCIDEICNLTSKKEIEKLENRKELLTAEKSQDPKVSELNIPFTDNYCIKNPKIKLPNGNTIECNAFAIIKCVEPSVESGLCIFDIQLAVKDSELIMKPKQIYQGFLPLGTTDKYKIVISDSNIKDLFVVLNTESGNAQLSVYQEKETSYSKESLISISSHNDYIPDVVKVTPKKIGQDDLIGKYIIKVYPETLSTYKLYYYVVYKNQNDENDKQSLPEVTMNLNIGQLISDYFPNDIRYKIYSFTPLYDKKSTIKIFINRVNINFDIYVFNDISKFEIVQLYELRRTPSKEAIKGYQWKSTANNEVIISKDDENYSTDKMLYIVVAPSDPLFIKPSTNTYANNSRFVDNLVSQYYIGIISEYTPISLSEGMPHTMTLSNSYTHQIYHRIHTNLEKNLEIVLNIFLGEIDIFVSNRYFKAEDIEKLDFDSAHYDSKTDTYELNKFMYKINLKSYSVLKLSSEFISNKLHLANSHSPNTHIYYYIRRSESMVKAKKLCQYVLVEKTSETKGQILQPGAITTGTLKVGNKAYFIIEEIEKRKSSYINVNFKKGSGNVYLRIPNRPEAHNRLRFPDEGYYDYKGNSIYSGKIINIPEKEYEKLGNSQNIKLQLLVTIVAETGTYENDEHSSSVISKNEVQYTISYSNEPKRLNQNVPFDGYLAQGQFEYFNFYFDNSTENIYIGLTNMNGDADMYLNRGRELPSMDKNHWRAIDSNHEYIEISKDDPYFKDNKVSISGYYTLLVVGFIDTSYSLYISSHKNKVFPLRDNIPSTCWCETKGEKCLFRYNEVFNKNNKEFGINHNEIIFTSEYLYGSGTMFSKVFIDKELYSSNEFYKNFPNKDDYDFSNKESNQRNYMKVKVQGDAYNKDSTVLLTLECNERSKVDITPTSLRHFTSVDYIPDNKENIYYLGINDRDYKQSQLTLILNNYMGKDKDLTYSLHSYIGDAHIKVYGNSSIWNEKTQQTTYDYKLLNEFDVITNDEELEFNIDVYNPYTRDYHNFISKKDKEKYDDIYFYIEPKTEFGFFITCIFDKNWNKVLLGKSQTFYVVNQELFGYFDISEDYSDVEFSLSVENNLKMYADLFIKINIIDKKKMTQMHKNEEKAKKDEFSLYHYSLPSDDNYDYKSVTDKTLGKIALNMNKLPKLSEKEILDGNKIIRALFYVRLGQIHFESLPQEDSSMSQENVEESQRKEDDNSQTIVNIMVTPGINNIKYIETRPFEYYFSNLTYSTFSMSQKVETKIYSLFCDNPYHDLLVIEISTCFGQYEINIQEELITKDNLNKPSIKYTETDDNGKKTIYIENIKSKHYYLSIKSKRDSFICKIHKLPDEQCGNNLSYLLYYFTAYSEHYSFQEIDKWIVHRPYRRGQIKLELPLIITNDFDLNRKDISDFKFDVFATKDQENVNYMGSACYLSRVESNKTKIFKIEHMTVENKSSLILKDLEPGNRYFINVLAQNTKTKELITFHPIEVFTGGRRPFFWRSTSFIIIIILTVVLIYYISKYRKAQEELIFLKGDTLPKTEYEMSNSYKFDSKNVQYSGLGSSY